MSNDEPHLVRVTIAFDPDSTPIAGRVEQGHRSPQAFEGMLELISIVEAARRSGRPARRNGGQAGVSH